MKQIKALLSNHWLLVFLIINSGLLAGSLWSSFVTTEEIRQFPAGLTVWKKGTFSLANDSPPLVRMAATLPALFTRTYLYFYDLKGTDILLDSCLREREEEFGANFAYANAPKYLGLVRVARAMNLLWWLLGAWVIGRWSRELHGGAAAVLGLALWCFDPNVLANEQVATPDLATAVAIVLATYTFDRYLKNPSWGRALTAGLVLGAAQLVDFTALVLYIVWPLLALLPRREPDKLSTRRYKVAESALQASAILLLSVWVVNLGYGFQGSGTLLRDHDFVSVALGAAPHSDGPPSGGEPTGNRLRGTLLGRVVVPVPADYLEGLDRRWHDWEKASHPRAEKDDSVAAGQNPLATLGTKIPLAVWVMVLWSLVLAVRRHPAGAPWADEVAVWLPAVAILAMTTRVASTLPYSYGALLMAPFVAVVASRLAYFLRPGHLRIGWLVVVLWLLAVGGSLATYPHPRSFLNATVASSGGVAARVRHGPHDGGPDLLSLKDWLRAHPKVHLRGMAVRDPIGPQLTGMRYPLPPSNPGSEVVGDPSYTRRVGPEPGYYALDPTNLIKAKFEYFTKFTPIYMIGSSIFVYHIAWEDAVRVRRELGLPTLERSNAGGGNTESGLLYRSFVDSRGVRSHYALFVPPEYLGDRSYPLILFLHGYGDRGTTGRQFTAVGLPPALESQKDGFGFLVICPQGQSGFWETGGDDARRAMELLAAVQKEYRVDPNRISLTGVSSGGTGVWNFAARYPDRWAAIVPVASRGDPGLAPLIKHIPCWCFHNSHDALSPVGNPRRMVAALRAAGGEPKYTEFFGLDHNCWDRAYGMPDLYDWLLRQKRPEDGALVSRRRAAPE